MGVIFKDRRHAGEKLARTLVDYIGRKDVIVLALPRGGVPVASEVCKELNLPLDVFIVRKLGFPGQEELAVGAIATNGTAVFNEEIADKVPGASIEQVIERESAELVKREKKYRHDKRFPDLSGVTVILVDDGIATGASMRVAIKALRQLNPAMIIGAVPVAPEESAELMSGSLDKFICLANPSPFGSVGQWYEDFSEVTDGEVVKLLRESWNEKEYHKALNA